MARPREFDQNEVLDRIVELFWARGFEATSIQDLEKATGLKRGSLYNAFGDKAALFRMALAHYLQGSAVRRWMAEIPNMRARSAVDNLLDRLAAEGAASEHGCLITNTMTELGARDPEVAEIVTGALHGLEKALEDLFTRAQSEGDLNPAADSKAMAQFVVVIVQGLRVLSKIRHDKTDLQRVADTAKQAIWERSDVDASRSSRGGFFDTLFGRPN